MSKSNFSVSLKCIVRGFFKDTMIIKDGSVLGYAPTVEQQRICFKLVHLILDDNGFFKPDTKNWLIGKNVYGGCADNSYTSRSRINYDLTKLSKALVLSDTLQSAPTTFYFIRFLKEKRQCITGTTGNCRHKLLDKTGRGLLLAKPLSENFIFS